MTISRKPVSRRDFNYALAIAGGAPTTAGYVQSTAIDVSGSSEDRLLLRFSYYMNAFVAGTSENPKVRIQLQYGTYYLVGAAGDAYPSWSTTPSFVDNEVPLDQYRKWQSYEVTTAGLPATGDLTLTMRIYQGINPSNAGFEEDRIEEILVQDCEIIYLPDGDFGTREDFIEETNAGYITKGPEVTLYHMDVPEEVANAKNIYANAFFLNTDGDATTAWKRSGESEAIPLADLLLRRMMNAYSAPVQRITNLTFRADGALPRPINRWVDPQQSTKKWMPVHLSVDLRTGDGVVELHEITAEDAPVPTAEGEGILLESVAEDNVLLESGDIIKLENN